MNPSLSSRTIATNGCSISAKLQRIDEWLTTAAWVIVRLVTAGNGWTLRISMVLGWTPRQTPFVSGRELCHPLADRITRIAAAVGQGLMCAIVDELTLRSKRDAPHHPGS